MALLNTYLFCFFITNWLTYLPEMRGPALSWLVFYIVIGWCAGCLDFGPLGMITGSILDWQISASSVYPSEWDRTCHERYARIYQPHSFGWCARYKTASEWLQIDLGVLAKVRWTIDLLTYLLRGIFPSFIGRLKDIWKCVSSTSVHVSWD